MLSFREIGAVAFAKFRRYNRSATSRHRAETRMWESAIRFFCSLYCYTSVKFLVISGDALGWEPPSVFDVVYAPFFFENE